MKKKMNKPFKTLFMLVVVAVTLLSGVSVALALSGTYVYANGGSYYTRYGPSGNWYTTSNEGFCGHISSDCSPNNMEYTYPSCPSSVNYAQWDNIDAAQWATHDVFIPRVNATTGAAPYTLTYNGASAYHFTINQNAYYDQWVRTDPSDPWWYDIRNTWLDDSTCEGGSPKIGFDEIRINY